MSAPSAPPCALVLLEGGGGGDSLPPPPPPRRQGGPPPRWVVSKELDPVVLPAVRRAARALARGRAELADDLAQEGLLAAHHAAAEWWPEGGMELRRWVMARARLRMISALRSELRLVAAPLDEVVDQLGDAGELAHALDDAIALREAVGRLPPAARQAVELLLRDLPVRQVEAVVARRYGRARARQALRSVTPR